MKKIILIVLLGLGLSTTLVGASTDDSIYDGSALISGSKNIIIAYERKNYSMKNQNESLMTGNLITKVCSNINFKNSINKGIVIQFIYLYGDGTMMIEINQCY